MDAIIQEKFRELFLEDMKREIDKIIANGEGYFKSKFVSMDDAVDYLESLHGWVDLDNFDSNGWQGDMRQSFRKGDKELNVSASGYYGWLIVEMNDYEEED